MFASNSKKADTVLSTCNNIPKYGWKSLFSYEFVRCQAFTTPRLAQTLEFLVSGIRYMRFLFRKKYIEKKKPFIDVIYHVPHDIIYGVPLGGIGSGTIGRGFRGEFCRFQMVPGMYEYSHVEANCFIVNIRKGGSTVFQRALVFERFRNPALQSWSWGLDTEQCAYLALYPRSWTVYNIPSQSVRLLCRQVSPVIPHDYKDSCLPTAVFVWSFINYGSDDLEISISFCFKNGVGTSMDKQGNVRTSTFGGETTGCLIHQIFQDMLCTYGISALSSDKNHVSVFPKYDPVKNGGKAAELWSGLMRTGRLLTVEEADKQLAEDALKMTKRGQEVACAVCCQTRVAASSTSSDVLFNLTWHMPRVHFRANENQYNRRYCRWFSAHESEGCIEISKHALHNFPEWEAKMDKWQTPVLNDESLPDWFKSALFNESYYLSDSGAVWLDADEQNPVMQEHARMWQSPVKQEMGLFAYLEGHEYRMYTTYDVHAYASWAFLLNFPKLQLAVQYDFAKATAETDSTSVYWIINNCKAPRTPQMSVPHDLGDPEDEPWVRVNSYIMMDTSGWRDLGPKFVVCVYRDWLRLRDDVYLRDMLPVVEGIMARSALWDSDGDGLVENSGMADQTYDAWHMTGISAYCAGLWIAACYSTSQMLQHLGHADRAAPWLDMFTKGRQSYIDTLWTGTHYQFDSSRKFRDCVMADQLFGYWMTTACSQSGEDSGLLPLDQVLKTLDTVYRSNVFSLHPKGAEDDGASSLLFNGARLSGGKDIRSVQSEECWIGVTYAVASLFLQKGRRTEAFNIAGGIYRTIWEDYGLGFQTPEAIFDNRLYRSLGYMRPLSVWSLYHSHVHHGASPLVANGHTT